MSSIKDIIIEGNIIHVPPLDLAIERKGLGCAVYDCMVKYKNRIAQINGITGERDSYGSFLQRCTRAAITMKALGITPGDVVTICTLNQLNTMVPYFGALFIGAKVSALDPSLSVDDTTHLLKEVTPKIIFVSSECIKLYEEVLKEFSEDIKLVVFGETHQYMNFSEFLVPKAEENEFKPREVEDIFETALIFFSSGISGLPKGICVSHYAVLGQVLNNLAYGFRFDVTLSTCSVYWTTTLGYLLMVIFTGSTRVLLPNFDYDNVCNAIDKYKPFNTTIDTATLYEMACNLPNHIDVSSLKQILPGGAHLTIKQIDRINETFYNAKLFRPYGQTETFMQITCFEPDSEEDIDLMIKKPTSCGRPLPGFSYMVVDPDTEEILGPNQQGELRLKTEFLLNGYYNQDSSIAWDKNGWYKTADIVYYDDDLCFYIVDRIKEMLKFREWHVSPAVIENILRSHPAVASTVVIGIPHELDGDHPMAIVVLQNSSKDVTSEDIKLFVEEKIDDRKKLRGGVKIVSSIPTNGSGKIDRRSIRDMVLRGQL